MDTLPYHILSKIFSGGALHFPRISCRNFRKVIDEDFVDSFDMGHPDALSFFQRIAKYGNLINVTLVLRSEEDIKSAVPHLKMLKKLETLTIQCHGDSKIIALSEAIGELKSLKKLTLKDTGLGIEGAKALCPSLLKLPELKDLNIAYNADLGQEGLFVLLPCFKNLDTLDISKTTNVPPLRMYEIFDQLTNLKSLKASANRIGWDENTDFHSLARSISGLYANIEILDLEMNDLETSNGKFGYLDLES